MKNCNLKVTVEAQNFSTLQNFQIFYFLGFLLWSKGSRAIIFSHNILSKMMFNKIRLFYCLQKSYHLQPHGKVPKLTVPVPAEWIVKISRYRTRIFFMRVILTNGADFCRKFICFVNLRLIVIQISEIVKYLLYPQNKLAACSKIYFSSTTQHLVKYVSKI